MVSVDKRIVDVNPLSCNLQGVVYCVYNKNQPLLFIAPKLSEWSVLGMYSQAKMNHYLCWTILIYLEAKT